MFISNRKALIFGFFLFVFGEKALADNNPWQEAIKQADAGHGDEALKILLPMIDRGDTAAQAIAGNLIVMRLISSRSEDEGVSLLKAAAAKGLGGAYFLLGAYYARHGTESGGSPAEIQTALDYFRASARLGDTEAPYLLAKYLTTFKDEKSKIEGLYWLRVGFAKREPRFVALMSQFFAGGGKDTDFTAAEGLMFDTAAGPVLRKGRTVIPQRSWRVRWEIEWFLHAALESQYPDRKKTLETQGAAEDGNENSEQEMPDHPESKYDKKDKLSPTEVIEYWSEDLVAGKWYLIALSGYQMRGASVTLGPEDIWHVLSAGDGVLISDDVTHHYTVIYRVDRSASRVFFIDKFPELFLLREGFNTYDIKAELVPIDLNRILVSVSKADFLKVCRGVLTWRANKGEIDE